ncbi:tetratricopeptide repeat protein [Micromonospora chokoriensis]
MTTIARLVEVHRLAVAGQEPAIAQDIGHRVSRIWLRRSRFADVAALANATLTLGPNAGAFYDLGWVQSTTGHPRQALLSYEQALNLYRETGHRGNEAATLTNIGGVYNRLGDRERALAYYEQALPIAREVGHRGNEAATLANIGGVYGRLGDRERALTYFEQALPIQREIGDRAGEATTLNNIGGVYANVSDGERALTYFEQALPIRREVGDRRGEATTLNNIGLTGISTRRSTNSKSSSTSTAKWTTQTSRRTLSCSNRYAKNEQRLGIRPDHFSVRARSSRSAAMMCPTAVDGLPSGGGSSRSARRQASSIRSRKLPKSSAVLSQAGSCSRNRSRALLAFSTNMVQSGWLSAVPGSTRVVGGRSRGHGPDCGPEACRSPCRGVIRASTGGKGRFEARPTPSTLSHECGVVGGDTVIS